MTRHISIEYDEAQEDPVYQGIVIRQTGPMPKGIPADLDTLVANTIRSTTEVIKFNSGDVVADFAEMNAWIGNNPHEGRYMYSSSVDHFVMDAIGFKWGLDENGRDVILRATEEEIAEQRHAHAELERENTIKPPLH